jgi:hypothetical protein
MLLAVHLCSKRNRVRVEASAHAELWCLGPSHLSKTVPRLSLADCRADRKARRQRLVEPAVEGGGVLIVRFPFDAHGQIDAANDFAGAWQRVARVDDCHPDGSIERLQQAGKRRRRYRRHAPFR